MLVLTYRYLFKFLLSILDMAVFKGPRMIQVSAPLLELLSYLVAASLLSALYFSQSTCYITSPDCYR